MPSTVVIVSLVVTDQFVLLVLQAPVVVYLNKDKSLRVVRWYGCSWTLRFGQFSILLHTSSEELPAPMVLEHAVNSFSHPPLPLEVRSPLMVRSELHISTLERLTIHCIKLGPGVLHKSVITKYLCEVKIPFKVPHQLQQTAKRMVVVHLPALKSHPIHVHLGEGYHPIW